MVDTHLAKVDVASSNLVSLPEGWRLDNGELINGGGERFGGFAGGFVSEFEDIDENDDGCISIKEFQKFRNEN